MWGGGTKYLALPFSIQMVIKMGMTKKLLLIAFAALLGGNVTSQTLATAYTFSTGVDSTLWVDIDSIAEDLITTGSGRSLLKDIGFTFTYAGTDYTQFSVNRFGMLRLGSTLATNSIPSSWRPLGNHVSNTEPGIVGIGINGYIDDSSYVRCAPVGNAGSRVLVVEMYIRFMTVDGRVKLQMQLFESSNNVRLIYGPQVGSAPPSAYQIGFATSSSDVALIHVAGDSLICANTTNQTNPSGSWPATWRWYQIDSDNDFCTSFATPWSEDFNTNDYMGCWTILDYDNSTYTTWHRSQYNYPGYEMWAYRDNFVCNDWLITPPIQLSDTTDGLMVAYDYLSGSNTQDYGEMDLRVADYDSVGPLPPIDTADFDPPLRHEYRGAEDYERRGASLKPYAGRRVRIAFVHVGLHSNNNIFIDNVLVANTTTPLVRLEMPVRGHVGDTVVIPAFLNEGSTDSITWTWQSTMAVRGLATLIPDSTTARIIYHTRGLDTISCTVTNSYGSDVATAELDVVDCNTVTHYPWSEDFEHGLDCWYQLGGWRTSGVNGTYEGENALISNSNSTVSSTSSRWIISQPFTLPALADTGMMEVIWRMRTRSSYRYGNNQFSLRVATVSGDAMPSESSFTTVFSKSMGYGDWERYSYDLSAYAGQTIRLMFHNIPNSDPFEAFVLIDNVEVRSTREPKIILEAPLRSEHLDSIVYKATFVEGDSLNLSYTWHSSLLNATFSYTDSILTMNYSQEGVDTMTLIASNAWGADTAVAIVHLLNCPAESVPFVANFEDSTALHCWSGFTTQYVGSWNVGHYERITDTTQWYRLGDSNNHYVCTSFNHSWLVTPAIDIPTDTIDLRLSWNQMGGYIKVAIDTGDSYYEEGDFNCVVQRQSSGTGLKSFSLGAYGGKRIRVGFMAMNGNNATIDNVSLAYYDVAPVAPLSAADSVMTGEMATITASLNDCSQRGLVVTWHSSLLDSTKIGGTTWQLAYSTAGIDTITFIAQNYYGADTQQVMIVVNDCDGYYNAPFSEDFNSTTGTTYNNASGQLPECWSYRWNGSAQNRPKVLQAWSYPFSSHYSNGLIMMAGTVTGWDTVAYTILPQINDSLYCLTLTLQYGYEDATCGTLTVGYLDSVGTFVPVADMTPAPASGRYDTISFSTAPRSATNIALRWRHTQSWYSVMVDNIRVFEREGSGVSRELLLIGPATASAYDTMHYNAIWRGDTTVSPTYSWQSQMANRGQAQMAATDSLLNIKWNACGQDTIILTASTASDTFTVRKAINVTGLPHVTINGPGTTTPGDSTLYTAILTSGIDTGTTYLWQSAMALRGQATLSNTTTLHPCIVYHASGTDTITLTLTTLLGSTTATKIVTIGNCPAISTFPYSEGFESGMPQCWLESSVGSVLTHWSVEMNNSNPSHNGSRCTFSNVYAGGTDWLLMPAVELPDSGAMELTFWAKTRFSYATLTVMASTTGRTSLASFTDTLFMESGLGNNSTYVARSISLAQYAGQTVYLAFVNGMSGGDVVWIDDVSIETCGVPAVSLSGPDSTRSCDSTTFEATLHSGDTAGLTYSWHSLMVARGMASARIDGNRIIIDYFQSGNDVVTVVATNAYGSDTAKRNCTVTDCEPITTFPYTTPLTQTSHLTCWDYRNYISNGSTWMLQDAGYTGHTCITANMGWPYDTADAWLIARELAIPNDNTHNYTLQWHVLCHHARYQVLASTTGRHQRECFTDTLYFEQCDTGSWHTRTASLDAYRGQRLYIAFHNMGWVNSATNYSDIGQIRIDTVGVAVVLDATPPDTVWHTLVAAAADPSTGRVAGGGRYPDSSMVTITALPTEGCCFDHWHDGDTTNPRQLLLVSDTAFYAYFQIVQDTTTGIDQLATLNTELTIYPNPASSMVTIETAHGDMVSLSLLDISGRMVFACKPRSNVAVLKVGDLPRGTYFVKVCTADEITVEKLCIQ